MGSYEYSSGAKQEVTTSGNFSCQLPVEIPVNDFSIDITKPIFDGQNLTDSRTGSLTLSTIVDGSTTKPLDFGSEVIVYLQQKLPQGLMVSSFYSVKFQ